MTPKEKIMACIKGRPMDEYVNQFEYLKLVFDPATLFAMGQVQSIDREKYFVAPFVAPGIFEKLHYLMGMEECMINFYDKPEVLFYFTGYV